MGIFGASKTRILDYEILLDFYKVTVKTEPHNASLKLEYCMLCFLYLSKVIYNYGGKDKTGSIMLLDNSSEISKGKIKANTDVFKLTKNMHYRLQMEYSPKVGNVRKKLNGTLFSLNNGNRILETHFSRDISTPEVLIGYLALLQHAINENKTNKKNLKLLNTWLSSMVAMYKDHFDGSSMKDVVGIPNVIFNEH